MNGYERISAAFSGIKTDRVPVMLHNFMPAAAESGMTMKEYREDPKNIAKAHLAMARKYGLDGILVDVDTCILASAIGVPVDYPVNLPARTIGHISNDIDEIIDAMDPQKVYQSDRIKIILDAINIMKNEAKGELFIRGNCDQMGFSLSTLAYGMERFLVDMLDPDCEEKILTLIDRATMVHLEFHKLMNQAGADITSFGDSPSGPDIISPRAYRKFAKPFHQKLNNNLHELGIQTICHICGRLDKIIDDIAEIGFPGIEIDYKTDLNKAVKAFSGKSVVFGPIDPSGVFCLGNPQMVRDETRKVLDIFSGKGIIIGAGCALPSETPEENIRAFMETVNNYLIS
jgi:uroporphyrinogen decarboxylase